MISDIMVSSIYLIYVAFLHRFMIVSEVLYSIHLSGGWNGGRDLFYEPGLFMFLIRVLMFIKF